jgi:TPR repeat protein
MAFELAKYIIEHEKQNVKMALNILNHLKDWWFENQTTVLNLIGKIYCEGTVVERDIKKGIKSFNSSKKRGCELAIRELGRIYVNGKYGVPIDKKKLRKSKLKCSMTESYDPYANAIAERVNGILKGEFIGYKNNFSIEIMRKLISDSINVYNNLRPHYSCFYKTPEQMHNQKQIKIKTYKKKNPVTTSLQDYN